MILLAPEFLKMSMENFPPGLADLKAKVGEGSWRICQGEFVKIFDNWLRLLNDRTEFPSDFFPAELSDRLVDRLFGDSPKKRNVGTFLSKFR